MYSVFINEYRRRKRRGPALSLEDLEQRFQRYVEVASDAEAAAATVAAWGTRLSPEVEAALKQLPPDYRAPVLLVDLAGLSYDEAAGVLQCPVGTVRSRLYRARKALFAALREYAAESGFLGGDG
jgi:RNA polymerase sigma-70 factor (ECF subfamily)